jgi:hypothetical protein
VAAAVLVATAGKTLVSVSALVMTDVVEFPSR